MSVTVTKGERRHALRVNTSIPTLIEVIGQREMQLDPALAAVYERVKPSAENVGKKFPGVVRDLSTNGAFLTGTPLPLLSRVAFTFPLESYGQIEVLGWTLWRRTADCEFTVAGQPKPVKLQAGFGVLFEAISLEARQAIAQLVARVAAK
jgi:hypothetical protein